MTCNSITGRSLAGDRRQTGHGCRAWMVLLAWPALLPMACDLGSVGPEIPALSKMPTAPPDGSATPGMAASSKTTVPKPVGENCWNAPEAVTDSLPLSWKVGRSNPVTSNGWRLLVGDGVETYPASPVTALGGAVGM